MSAIDSDIELLIYIATSVTSSLISLSPHPLVIFCASRCVCYIRFFPPSLILNPTQPKKGQFPSVDLRSAPRAFSDSSLHPTFFFPLSHRISAHRIASAKYRCAGQRRHLERTSNRTSKQPVIWFLLYFLFFCIYAPFQAKTFPTKRQERTEGHSKLEPPTSGCHTTDLPADSATTFCDTSGNPPSNREPASLLPFSLPPKQACRVL